MGHTWSAGAGLVTFSRQDEIGNTPKTGLRYASFSTQTLDFLNSLRFYESLENLSKSIFGRNTRFLRAFKYLCSRAFLGVVASICEAQQAWHLEDPFWPKSKQAKRTYSMFWDCWRHFGGIE